MVAPTPGAYPGARFSRGSDMLINALPDYGVTGTLGGVVVLQGSPNIHAPNFQGSGGAGSGYFAVDGVVFGQRATNYHQILTTNGVAALQLGNASDPTSYYNNNTHNFRNAALTGMMTVTLSGSDASITASGTNANLLLNPNGTGRAKLSRGELTGGSLIKGVYILASSNVAGSAHTGDTLETTLATIQVPANAMGANGTLRITVTARCTGTAGTKTLRVKFGGTTFSETANGTTILSVRNAAHVSNRNATNSQIGMGAGSTGYGGSTSDVTTGAIDTTANQDITITVQLANAADSGAIAQYLVELIVP